MEHQVERLVARLIAVTGVDEVREKLQAVLAKGGSGDDGSRQAHTMPQSFRQRRWETRTVREEPWEVPQPARRLDPRAQNRYGARWRIGKARAAKARQVQAWKALPRPREMQRTAARKTEAWEAKVVSRLEEEKNRLGESRCDEEVMLPKPREQVAKKAEVEVNGDEAEARKGAVKAKEAQDRRAQEEQSRQVEDALLR